MKRLKKVLIIKLITSSKWFTRSWTYQEGWLSRHTVFMFDDKLIDGRAMAGTWALNQLSYASEGKYNSRAEFQKGTKKIATPLGWTYCRDGYSLEDKVELDLNQVLKTMKSRKRTLPIDGIYSILGLLPYGEKVKVDYTKTPEQALYDVMKAAVGNGHAEPIAWHGASSKTPGLCWMPQIDEYGSTSVEGGMNISSGWIGFRKEGIRLEATKYDIEKVSRNINKIEGGFEIDNGLWKKDVEVKAKIPEEEWSEKNQELIEITLFGTRETLESVQENNVLVVLEKDKWKSKRPFAILLAETKEKESTYDSVLEEEKELNIYHRIGLVELGNGEKLKVVEEEYITIGINNSNDQINKKKSSAISQLGNLQSQLQAQIQQSNPPPNN